MGCSIQFESQVEFLAIYAMERDEAVLEYYDQPTRIQLPLAHPTGPHAVTLRGDGSTSPDWLSASRSDQVWLRAERRPTVTKTVSAVYPP